MLWGFQPIGFLKIRILEEKAAHFRGEKQNAAEEEQEYGDALYVMDRVIGVELDTIQRHTVWPLVLLDLNAIWVVRAHFMECENVQHHERQQHDGQGHHVQGEETVQRDA